MHPSRSVARLSCIALASLLARSALANGVAAPLRVEERQGLQRRSWPVTLGVPLPSSGAGEGDTFVVVSAKGATRVPTQSRTLARWTGGGGPRWVLVDFQTDLAPGQKLDFALQPGTPPAPKTKVSARQQGADVEIDTGVVRLLVGKGSGGLFRLQSLDGKSLEAGPVRAEMTTANRVAPALPPEKVGIEDAGPLRATVTLSGRYANGFEYEIRLHAFAGQPYVRVEHTFINTNDAPTTPIERASLFVPAPAKGERRYDALLEGGQRLGGKLAAGAVVLTQADNNSIRRDGQTQPGKLDGWFELHGEGLSLGLDAPFFWQQYPQAVRFLPDGLRYDLWAEGERPAAIGVGAAKTHEFYLVFGKGADLVVQPSRGVTAFADPTFTARSGALLNAVDPDRERAFVAAAGAAFERTVRSLDVEVWDEAGACAEPATEIRRRGCYGMLHWGDWNFRGYHDDTKGCDAWGNEEYDLSQVLGLLFAATGRADVRALFTAAARHYGEVDVIHHQPQYPEWVGMNHPKNPQHFRFEYGGVDLGHTWVEGLFTHHFLTGDTRSWKAALGISDYLVRRLRRTVRGNPRQFGWPALALAAAWEATGKREYYDAARQYARLGIAAHPVPEKIGKDWKLGILADGVSYVHALSRDPSLQPWLEAYAATVVKSQAKDIRFYPAVAYVARLNGDPALRQAARTVAERLKFGDWAKPFTIGGRTGFRILSQVDAR